MKSSFYPGSWWREISLRVVGLLLMQPLLEVINRVQVND